MTQQNEQDKNYAAEHPQDVRQSSHEQDARQSSHGPELTLQEYEKMLKRHDWHYEYSDDHSVWKRGNEAHKELKRLAEELGGAFLALYRSYFEKHFPPFHRSTDEPPQGGEEAGGGEVIGSR